MQAAEKPTAKPDEEEGECSDEDSSDEEEKPAAKAAPANPIAEITDEKEESSSEDNITEDIDVRKVSKPTKSNYSCHNTKAK